MEISTAILTSFFKTAQADPHLGTTHLTVYTAIYTFLLERGGNQPVLFSSSELRQRAKLSSRTYYKCMRELEVYKYIEYQRSFSHVDATAVYLLSPQNERTNL